MYFISEIFTINSIATQFGGPILKKFIWWSCLDIPKFSHYLQNLNIDTRNFLFIDRTFVYRGGEGERGGMGEGASGSQSQVLHRHLILFLILLRPISEPDA